MTTTNDALVIELQDVFDTGLAMRVVHQDETRIPRGRAEFCVKEITIRSVCSPSFSRRTIHVRGNSVDEDGRTSLLNLPTKQERDAYRDRLTEAVAELNRQLAPKRRVKGWCNVYAGTSGLGISFGGSIPHATREEADMRGNTDRLGVIYIDAEVQP